MITVEASCKPCGSVKFTNLTLAGLPLYLVADLPEGAFYMNPKTLQKMEELLIFTEHGEIVVEATKK